MPAADGGSDAAFDSVRERLSRDALSYVRCQFIDFIGVARGREVSAGYLERHWRRGVGIAPVNYTFDIEDLDYDRRFGPEAGDVWLVPDLSSLVPLAYTPGSGHVFGDLVGADGRPWSACSRQALKKVQATVEAEVGHVLMGFEQEGYLLVKGPRGYEPAGDAKHHTSDFFDTHQAFTADLLEVLDRMGTPLEKFNLEDGAGMIELNARPGPPLVAAEQYFRTKQAYRFVSRRHGFLGGFMPKPFTHLAGAGLHVHLSVRAEDGSNPFMGEAGSGPDGLSVIGRRFVGGLLRHVGAVIAFGCPSVNSYRRLQPGAFAPTHAAWGIGNRSAMVRVVRTVPGNGADPGLRLEVRTGDGTCNPHLYAAALLAAGLDGVRKGVEPGSPVDTDLGATPPAVLAAAGVARLPRNLEASLDLLQADIEMRDALGGDVVDGFVRTKRIEWSKYCAHVSDWEQRQYAEAY